jgi:hypothetical protein
MSTQQAAPGEHGTAHSRPQGEHDGILEAVRRAPHDLARQGHARVVVGEYRDIQRHTHQIGQGQALQEVERSRQDLDARRVSIDFAFTTHPDRAGLSGSVDQPVQGMAEGAAKALQFVGRRDRPSGQDRALLIHHACPHLGATDVNPEHHHDNPFLPDQNAPSSVDIHHLAGNRPSRFAQQE